MHLFSFVVSPAAGRCVRNMAAFALAAALGLGAFGLAAARADDAPIDIEADRMVSRENENAVAFLGKVVARQGPMTIRASSMTVYYDNSAKGDKAAGQIDRLICQRDVKITQGDWLGTGDRLDYFAKTRKAVLSGNAKAWNGPNMVSGKTITYFMNEKRSEVDRDDGPVRAVFRAGTGQ